MRSLISWLAHSFLPSSPGPCMGWLVLAAISVPRWPCCPGGIHVASGPAAQ